MAWIVLAVIAFVMISSVLYVTGLYNGLIVSSTQSIRPGPTSTCS